MFANPRLMRNRSLWVLPCLGLLLLPGLAFACANYSQSELDDQTVRRVLAASDRAAFVLITRTFPHHSQPYWATLERESRALVGRSDDGSIGARDDLAVAVLKQGRYDEARRMLLALDRQQPNRYRTLSNLGVLEKKAGRYLLAADYLARALEVRPGGHMGLGDFYLRAARWQGEAQRSTPQEDFLGQPYDTRRRSWSDQDLVYLHTLIHNDRDFPDAYLVLGDRLLASREPLLAAYAYVQARRLKHPAQRVLDRRLRAAHARMAARTSGPLASIRSKLEAPGGGPDGSPPSPRRQLVGVAELERVLDGLLSQSASWSVAFEQEQGRRLRSGTAGASLEVVAERLTWARLEPEVALPDLFVVQPSASRPKRHQALMGLLALLLFVLVARRVRQRGRSSGPPAAPGSLAQATIEGGAEERRALDHSL